MVRAVILLMFLAATSYAQTARIRTTDGWKRLGGISFAGDSAYVPSGPGGSTDSSVFATNARLADSLDGFERLGHTHPYALVAKLASDATTGANTTPISLSGLAFNFAANSTYRINFYGNVSPAAATTGCGFQFDVSAAVTMISVSFHHQLANTGTLSGGSSIADDASAGVSSGMPANGGVYPVVGAGIIVTGANTGTAQLRFRSETTAATTAKAGLTLIVEKVQ